MAFGKKIEHRSPRPDHCSVLKKKFYMHVQNLVGESPLLTPLHSLVSLSALFTLIFLLTTVTYILTDCH